MSKIVKKYRDLIYDIGLHHGEDTEFYLLKGFRVIAFEADPEHVNICKIKFKEHIESGQLLIVEGAIVDFNTIEEGQDKVTFYKDDNVSVWGTVCKEWVERNEKYGSSAHAIEVGVIDFSDILKRHGIPYYMKVDIEGCDRVCLHALEDFEERPDYISIESDRSGFADMREEIQQFVRLGYGHFQAIEQSQLSAVQLPPKPAREGNYVSHEFKRGSSGLFGAELEAAWETEAQVLVHYRLIALAYFLLDTNNGLIGRWKFKGASRLQSIPRYILSRLLKAEVPGWYDTHAKHSSVN